MTKLNSGVFPTELTNPLAGLLNNGNERKRHLLCLISKFWTFFPIGESHRPLSLHRAERLPGGEIPELSTKG